MPLARVIDEALAGGQIVGVAIRDEGIVVAVVAVRDADDEPEGGDEQRAAEVGPRYQLCLPDAHALGRCVGTPHHR
jgi:hypothetical protein